MVLVEEYLHLLSRSVIQSVPHVAGNDDLVFEGDGHGIHTISVLVSDMVKWEKP